MIEQIPFENTETHVAINYYGFGFWIYLHIVQFSIADETLKYHKIIDEKKTHTHTLQKYIVKAPFVYEAHAQKCLRA